MKPHSLELQYFFLSLCFFLIFVPMGNLPSDTEYSVETALSMSKGTISIAPTPALPDLKAGRNGHYYSKFGIGYAALFIPAALATRLSGHFLPVSQNYLLHIFSCFTNTIVASLIIVLFVRLFLILGYTRKVIFFTVLLIATGSILLPYSKINHSEIPTAALLLLFLIKLHSCKKLSFNNGLLFGIIGSALLLLRIGNIVYSLCIFAYGFYLILRGKFSKQGALSLFLLPLLTLVFFIALNIYRFGNPFNTGYGSEQHLFTTPLIRGLSGLLLSPSRSLFLFSPLIILALWSIRSAASRFPKITFIIAAMSAGNLIFYARWHDWHGGWAWGPRLIVPSILLLHVFLPEFILNMKNSISKRVIFALIVPIAIFINILGSLVWYQQTYYFFRHDYYSISNSQPLIAAKLLSNKLKGAPEVYKCSDFNQDCSGEFYRNIYGDFINENTIDFSDFQTFQGLAVFWNCIARNMNLHFLWMIPLILISFTSAISCHIWKLSLEKVTR